MGVLIKGSFVPSGEAGRSGSVPGRDMMSWTDVSQTNGELRIVTLDEEARTRCGSASSKPKCLGWDDGEEAAVAVDEVARILQTANGGSDCRGDSAAVTAGKLKSTW